jgi:hypothetical protein
MIRWRLSSAQQLARISTCLDLNIIGKYWPNRTGRATWSSVLADKY